MTKEGLAARTAAFSTVCVPQNTKIHESAKLKPEQLRAQAELPRPARRAQIPFYILLPTAFEAQPHGFPPAA